MSPALPLLHHFSDARRRRSTARSIGEIRKQAQALSKIGNAELLNAAELLRNGLAADAKSQRGGRRFFLHRDTGVHRPNPALLHTAFALATEAVRRSTGMVYYDVQLMAGLALARGEVAQMATGEGKTIVAGLPAIYHGLRGGGVHVATTNHYLAGRDCDELRGAFDAVGLTVGLLPEPYAPSATVTAYQADITYGTGYQFGFDYLRDQLILRDHGKPTPGRVATRALRGRHQEAPVACRKRAFAIVDEIDSVMLDEANTPLIMAVRGEIEPSPPYLLAHSTASEMQLDQHYHYDHRETRIDMTEEGYAFAMKALQQSGIRSLARPWARYVSNALRAIVVLRLDDDYIIGPHEGKTKVQIVDKFTGRILPERTWSDGLHQAVEVKENLPNSEPNDTNASISRQRYFPLYDSMCGMTGTALGSEREFRDFYGLHVTNIPTNRPNILSVAKPRYFVDTASKLDAVATDVQHRHQDRQPILIGTRTIASSKQVAQVLEQRGLAVTILNGVQDAEEAEIVAGAGNPDSILIATNMAGRGTDIKLKPAAKDAGGLHVIVLEHHESQRVDRQLIGRAARQGNPGSYQYMISAEDEVLVRYGPTLADSMQRSAQATGESKRCFAADIDRLQSKVQKQFYKQRQQMVDRDKWNDHVLNRFWNETTN